MWHIFDVRDTPSFPVKCGAIKDDVSTTDILALISGSCNAAGHNGFDHDGLQRFIDIVIAGICQPAER
jgi:hypothetical protein